MLHNLCTTFHALPRAGGVLDQDVSVIRMLAVLREGGFFDEEEEGQRGGREIEEGEPPMIPMFALT